MQVRELGYRWGSCGHKGDLYFHWRVAMLPRTMIEYVVVHELVHLIEPHHTNAFWNRVERVVSDGCDRKQWLAENGGVMTFRDEGEALSQNGDSLCKSGLCWILCSTNSVYFPIFPT